MRICHCTHAEGVHTEEGAGYCFAVDCLCEAFRENVQASASATKSIEDETQRESNGYEDTKPEGGDRS